MYPRSFYLRMAVLCITGGIAILALTPGTARPTPYELFKTPSGYTWLDKSGKSWQHFKHSSGSGSSVTSQHNGTVQTWSLYPTPSGVLVVPGPGMGELKHPALTAPRTNSSLSE